MTLRDNDLVSLFLASRVEVFIGSSRSGRSPVVANAAFKRLGYIAFSSNQQNGYRVSQPCHLRCQGDCSQVAPPCSPVSSSPSLSTCPVSLLSLCFMRTTSITSTCSTRWVWSGHLMGVSPQLTVYVYITSKCA